jgi:hypothetical protein
MDGEARGPAPLPIGTGQGPMLEAISLSAGVARALLVRQADAPRLLVSADAHAQSEAPYESRERLVVVPLDDDVEVRPDADALAAWVAGGLTTKPAPSAPAWASGLGTVLLLVILGFTVLGGATFFAWLIRALGGP